METVAEQVIENTWKLWGNAIGWAMIGILFVKAMAYKRKTKFSISFWIGDNIVDVVRGLFLTLITVKLGDIIIDILKVGGLDLSWVKEAMNSTNMDPIQFSLVIAILFQYWLLRRREAKPDTIADDTVDPTKPGGPKT
jgi:hypothetical protein